jgi:hypothetical protein
MVSAIARQPYEALLSDYEAALAWMAEIGVRLGSGRTKRYKKILEYWSNNYRNASIEEGQNVFPDFVGSLYELGAFLEIYQSLRGSKENDLSQVISKLNKAVKGPVYSSEESPQSTTARNRLFEVLVTAKCHKPESGLVANLLSDTDAGFSFLQKKLWIECKRVASVRKLESNVRDACNQVNKSLKRKTGTGHRGIVALEISKLINPGDDLYVAPDEPTLLRAIDKLMNRFIESHFLIWERIYKEKGRKILGTMLRFSFMATSENDNLLVSSTQWAANPREGLSPFEFNFMQEFVYCINPQERFLRAH